MTQEIVPVSSNPNPGTSCSLILFSSTYILYLIINSIFPLLRFSLLLVLPSELLSAVGIVVSLGTDSCPAADLVFLCSRKKQQSDVEMKQWRYFHRV